jgi:hypothetical protein
MDENPFGIPAIERSNLSGFNFSRSFQKASFFHLLQKQKTPLLLGCFIKRD